MNKQDTIGVVLRKFDYLWNKRGWHFCDIVKYLYPENFEKGNFPKEITDDELIQRLKDVHPNEKEKE